MFKSLCFAMLFLTRIPVPKAWQHFDSQTQSQSIYWHPFVGLLIGGILLTLLLLLQQTSLAAYPMPSAALITLAWILLTGGLHLDGLGDSADGWLGGYGDRERTLAIMKDSHSGAASVIAISSILLLKVSALAAVIQISPLGLLITPLLARTTSIVLFASTSYARKEGLGSPFSQGLNVPAILVICFVIASVLTFYVGIAGLYLCVAYGSMTIALRHLMIQRIGGTTGDTAGATIEINEAFGLLFIIALT